MGKVSEIQLLMHLNPPEQYMYRSIYEILQKVRVGYNK